MERLCGRLRSLVLSRVHPYAGLTARAQIVEEVSMVNLRSTTPLVTIPDRNALPSKCFRLRRPADNWILRGDRDKDDLRDDDDDNSDDKDSEEYTLFVRVQRRPATLDETLVDPPAARLAKDTDRGGRASQFVTEIWRLIDAGALCAWGRLAFANKNVRVRAKDTEHESFRDRGHDTSHVLFDRPSTHGTFAQRVGKVKLLFAFNRAALPPHFFDMSPFGPDSIFQRRHSLPFAIIQEFKSISHPHLPRLKYIRPTDAGTLRIEWIWNISRLVGRITLNHRIFIIDRDGGQTRATEALEMEPPEEEN
ncbi:hypothetical protein BOTBODRAFT_363257 [Botryobasidium botryosum FD-172 SS1]|uniref:Uncharacterized protein n=1 Tax=Botryobasidium botryosum (strain FD-172 SS1) TaxID=930990 RepID=A0A067MFV9_BOTB1|nr:hypothetical protein BOTBODRAFT_363257 [Botryobasidium botryosum FD-172 SS1]